MTKIGALVSFLGLAACGGQTASTDPSSQAAQADTVTTADASAPHGHHRGPPPEALAACASKAAGDSCTVTLDDETLPGTCTAPPADSGATTAACRPDKMPEHGPSGRPHGPPPEAIFTACAGKATDTTCSVTFHDHAVDGTCKVTPDAANETRLGCRPAHGPRHP